MAVAVVIECKGATLDQYERLVGQHRVGHGAGGALPVG